MTPGAGRSCRPQARPGEAHAGEARWVRCPEVQEPPPVGWPGRPVAVPDASEERSPVTQPAPGSLSRYADLARLLVRYGRSDLASTIGLDGSAVPGATTEPGDRATAESF